MLERLGEVHARIEELRRRFAMPESGRAAPEGPRGLPAPSDDAAALAPASLSFGGELKLALARRPEGAGAPRAGGAEVEGTIQSAARRYGLDPALLRAVIEQESGFNPKAISAAGALGLMQLMPGTARDLGVTDPFDPAQNIDAGARYLRQQIDSFGSLPLALAAYNAGPGAVRRYGGVPPYAETRTYVERILDSLGRAR